METIHEKRFPNESEEYRTKRNALLKEEMKLRKQIESVAARRRALPLGGKIKEDYIFEEGAADLPDRERVNNVMFSDLFEDGKDSLFIYSFMFSPDTETPCTSCTSILDGLDGQARHIRDRVNFAVVAKAPIQQLRDWARGRGWDGLRLLSSYHNSYNKDYGAETVDGNQLPAVNVFKKEGDDIHHFYNTELLYAPSEKGQNARHADMIWPLWNVFDMTPQGRGVDWYPKHQYDLD